MMNRFSRVAVVCAAFALAFGIAQADSGQLIFLVGTLTAEAQDGSGAEARALVILGRHGSTQTYQLRSLTDPSGAELMPATWYPRTLQGALVAYGLNEGEAGVYVATLERDGEIIELRAELTWDQLLPLPAGVEVEVGADGVVVAWRPTSGAEAYQVSLFLLGASEVLATQSTQSTRVVFDEILGAGTYFAVVRAYAFDWLGTAERPLDLAALPERLAASELHVRFDIRY